MNRIMFKFNIKLVFSSFNANLLKETIISLINKIKLLKLNYNLISLPQKIKKFCLLRSPHVNKNSMEHFSLKISKSFINCNFSNILDINFLLSLKLNSSVKIAFILTHI